MDDNRNRSNGYSAGLERTGWQLQHGDDALLRGYDFDRSVCRSRHKLRRSAVDVLDLGHVCHSGHAESDPHGQPEHVTRVAVLGYLDLAALLADLHSSSR